jgi:hypothetical protein
MPPATTSFASPARIGLRREHHGLEPGAADLVDGHGRNRRGDSAVHGRLARRRLPGSGGHHVPHDDLVDLTDIDARRSTAARTAIAPSSGPKAGSGPPRKRPMGCARPLQDDGGLDASAISVQKPLMSWFNVRTSIPEARASPRKPSRYPKNRLVSRLVVGGHACTARSAGLEGGTSAPGPGPRRARAARGGLKASGRLRTPTAGDPRPDRGVPREPPDRARRPAATPPRAPASRGLAWIRASRAARGRIP